MRNMYTYNYSFFCLNLARILDALPHAGKAIVSGTNLNVRMCKENEAAQEVDLEQEARDTIGWNNDGQRSRQQKKQNGYTLAARAGQVKWPTSLGGIASESPGHRSGHHS